MGIETHYSDSGVDTEGRNIVFEGKSISVGVSQNKVKRQTQVLQQAPPALMVGMWNGQVENGKAQLVAIAHDVDPIELVVWLPALCKKMGVPYCIVKVHICLLLPLGGLSKPPAFEHQA